MRISVAPRRVFDIALPALLVGHLPDVGHVGVGLRVHTGRRLVFATLCARSRRNSELGCSNNGDDLLLEMYVKV